MQFKRIVVNPTQQVVRDPVIDFARQIGQKHGATITVFDVAPDLSWPIQFFAGGWEQLIEDISGRKRKKMTAIVDTLSKEGLDAEYVLGQGRLSGAIVQQVLADDHDLVVKVAETSASNRSGFLGSTDYRLLRKCPCPVLILKADQENDFKNVAVAVDVMDDHALQRALDVAVLAAADAVSDTAPNLVYSLPPIEEVIDIDADDRDLITGSQMEKWDAELVESAGQRLEELRQHHCSSESKQHLLRGAPEEAIPDYVRSHGIDLLVMGTIARSGIDGLFMGNTAERILGQVNCAILALKPAGLVSPSANITNSSAHSS